MTGATPSSIPPKLPHHREDAVFNRLRLLRSRRVGVATYWRLMREHGTAERALDALPQIAKDAGVSNYQICPAGVVNAEMRAGRAAGAFLIDHEHPDYPEAIRPLGDAPPLFWAIGDRALLGRRAIALVGARNASSLGTRMAKRLSAELGEAGFAVVSGLARGIDAAAHHAAISTGTIAVQAGGVDVLYPAENAKLAQDIAATGLRVSEAAMGLQPQARHFPARNRIISGLSEAVIVIEAAAKSGSLITARNALDQSRDVLAVPGHPLDARAAGCNMLIRDGAVLVRNAEDVIEAIGSADTGQAQLKFPDHPTKPVDLRAVAQLHDQIMNRLSPSPIAEDQLIRDLESDAKTLAPAILDLELDGKIERQAGGMLARLV